MRRTITTTQARQNFADIINRIQYSGEEFVISKQGKPVAMIITVQDEAGKLTNAQVPKLPVYHLGGATDTYRRADLYNE